MEARVSEKKKKQIEEIKKLIESYPIFGIVDMENLPASQLQKIKTKLEGKIKIKMYKKRLLKIALDQMKKEKFEEVKERLKGMPALILTKENPFALSKLLSQNKSKAAAKPGQTAPNDISVEAGSTPFPPGPIISELGRVGLKTGVEGGKVAIKEEKTMVKEGEVIKAEIADILSKLGIEPMEIGLNLLLVYENGLIYGKDVLAIDEKEYIGSLVRIYNDALILSIEIGFITKDNVEKMIDKANSDAETLAREKNLDYEEEAKREDEESKEAATAEPQPSEETKEEIKDEKPKEEPKAEAVKEDMEMPKEEFKAQKREKKPSAEELVKEAEEEVEKEKEKDKKKREIEEVEKLAKDILSGKMPRK